MLACFIVCLYFNFSPWEGHDSILIDVSFSCQLHGPDGLNANLSWRVTHKGFASWSQLFCNHIRITEIPVKCPVNVVIWKYEESLNYLPTVKYTHLLRNWFLKALLSSPCGFYCEMFEGPLLWLEWIVLFSHEGGFLLANVSHGLSWEGYCNLLIGDAS